MLRALLYSGMCLGLAWNASAFAAHSPQHPAAKPAVSKTVVAKKTPAKATPQASAAGKLTATVFLKDILKIPVKNHKKYQIASITPRKVGRKNETWVLYKQDAKFGFARVNFVQKKWQIVKHDANFYQNGVTNYVFKKASLKLFGVKTLIAIEDGEGGVMPKTTLRLFDPFSLNTAGEIMLSAKMSPVDGADFETSKLELKSDVAGISDILLTQKMQTSSRAGTRKFVRTVTYRWIKEKNCYVVGATRDEEVI